MLDPVAQPIGDDRRVIAKPIDQLPVEKSTAFLQRLRQIPVVKRDPGRDVGGEEFVDQTIIEGLALAIGFTGTGGLDARPRK